MVYLFYTTYISVDLAHHEIFHAKVGKGGINGVIMFHILHYFHAIIENFKPES